MVKYGTSFAVPNPSHAAPEIDLSEFALPAILPDDIATLQALLIAQHQTYTAAVADAVKKAVAATRAEAQAQMQRMIEQLVLARHRQFGTVAWSGAPVR